jgi:hypothetical protein
MKIRLPWLTIIVLSCVVFGVTYRMTRVAQTLQTGLPSASGWDDLGTCAAAISFDGNKKLTLSHDQQVELWDHSLRNKTDPDRDVMKGNWRYDRGSKRYLITLRAQTAAYRLIRPPGSCVLLKGELAAANLEESWFAARDMHREDYHPIEYEPAPVRGN